MTSSTPKRSLRTTVRPTLPATRIRLHVDDERADGHVVLLILGDLGGYALVGRADRVGARGAYPVMAVRQGQSDIVGWRPGAPRCAAPLQGNRRAGNCGAQHGNHFARRSPCPVSCEKNRNIMRGSRGESGTGGETAARRREVYDDSAREEGGMRRLRRDDA